ncbi:VC0807 family protein [Pseudonocardia halophobica]|uniref:VC0807 family protein n=1 Tax=Pseudonocardia halophobica TaxID=29401 RepID=UPI003D8FC6B1
MRGGPMRRADLLLGIVAPIAAYWVLTALGAPDLTALAWGVLFPLAGVVVGIARERRVDVLAALSLGAIAVSLAGALLLHSATFLLVKESLVTGVIGVGFLGSLLARRPLPVLLLRGRPGAAEVMEARWVDPGFRRALRGITIVWGCALLAEAGLRVVLALFVPPGVLMVVSPLLAAAVLGPVALWTARRRGALRRTPVPVPA